MKKIAKSVAIAAAAAIVMLVPACGSSGESKLPEEITLTKGRLLDKIKGGWAGQTLGVTYGSETEFLYNGTYIQDYQPITWYKGYVRDLMEERPGIYDDIYMDLTFVEVFEREGFEAPVDSFATAFAHADYELWHANQVARYNIVKGVENPGHWLNNPHADDIDYQIEADFAGLMSPGMPNTASEISDRIGHLMNYGDGWYGGVYVGAMYSLAFISDDVEFVVTEALKAIPAESRFHRCITDVIRWWRTYPDDWHRTWFEILQHYSEDVGCPDGVFKAFNIDATVNAAYVVLGLLYGGGDFGRTVDIATRAGYDSDCNPATAGGILGAILGYDRIPEYWMQGLDGAEQLNFKYTDMSLERVYEVSNRHALEMILRNGGRIDGEQVTIRVQSPQSVGFEQSFPGMYPVRVVDFYTEQQNPIEFEFEGTGFVLRGDAQRKSDDAPYGELEATLWIDGEAVETAGFPLSYKYRRHDLFWRYQLPKGKHSIRVEYDAKSPYYLRTWDYVIYSDEPRASLPGA